MNGEIDLVLMLRKDVPKLVQSGRISAPVRPALGEQVELRLFETSVELAKSYLREISRGMVIGIVRSDGEIERSDRGEVAAIDRWRASLSAASMSGPVGA